MRKLSIFIIVIIFCQPYALAGGAVNKPAQQTENLRGFLKSLAAISVYAMMCDRYEMRSRGTDVRNMRLNLKAYNDAISAFGQQQTDTILDTYRNDESYAWSRLNENEQKDNCQKNSALFREIVTKKTVDQLQRFPVLYKPAKAAEIPTKNPIVPAG